MLDRLIDWFANIAKSAKEKKIIADLETQIPDLKQKIDDLNQMSKDVTAILRQAQIDRYKKLGIDITKES